MIASASLPRLGHRLPLRFIFVVCLLPTVTSSPAEAAPPVDLALRSLEMTDHRGRVWSLADLLASEPGRDGVTSNDAAKPDRGQADDAGRSAELVVVAFLGTECPLAKLYSVRLGELAEEYASRGVRVVGVISNRQDSLQKIAAFVRRQAIAYPVLKDPGNRFADRLGAERTPEVFVFDAFGGLRYWGRIDDRYGIGYARDEPTREDLREALDDLLAGRDVAVPRTRSVGCLIGRSRPSDDGSEVTYVNSIAEILQNRCRECHRQGEIAPFAMEDPDEVAGWADMMVEVVREGRMPPWHASPEHGEFANDRSMPAAEKEKLYAWAAAGAPLGDLEADGGQLPEPPPFVAGWQLPRQPDRVIEIGPEPFQVPATGVVEYKYFRVDPKIDQDVWLESAELLPGNRAVVHHILAFTRPRGSDEGLNGARGFLVGYVPGARNEPWPRGMAKRIPGGSELIFQVHYTPIGTPQEDHSRLGLCFADPATITHEVITTSALETGFKIPPGDAAFVVRADSPVHKSDAWLLGMSPHMHLRGKAFRYDLSRGNGDRETLLDVPAYDFNWQTTYVLADPLRLRPGDRILGTATYDNSPANLNNPDPSKEVGWGDQTQDEMMIGYYHYAVAIDRDGDAPIAEEATGGRQRRLRQRAAIAASSRLRRFEELDRDGDGRLARGDVPATLLPVFDALDANGDGVLTRAEVVRGEANGQKP